MKYFFWFINFFLFFQADTSRRSWNDDHHRRQQRLSRQYRRQLDQQQHRHIRQCRHRHLQQCGWQQWAWNVGGNERQNDTPFIVGFKFVKFSRSAGPGHHQDVCRTSAQVLILIAVIHKWRHAKMIILDLFGAFHKLHNTNLAQIWSPSIKVCWYEVESLAEKTDAFVCS